MNIVEGKSFEDDRIEMTSDEKLAIKRLLDNPNWPVFRDYLTARATMTKNRLYRRSMTGTNDCNPAPLVAYLRALEDALSVREIHT